MFLEGVVQNIIFHNHENGFIVFNLRTSRGLNKITGFSNSIYEGDFIKIEGESDSFNGESQFKIKTFEKKEPETSADIINYLSSKRFKGIGSKLAIKIVDQFEDKTLEVIQNNPELLKSVRGITNSIINNLKNKILKDKKYSELEKYLMPFNIGNYWILKIFEKNGLDSLSIIKENPYILLQQFPESITLHTIDIIAKELKIDLLDYRRSEAGIFLSIHFNSQQTGDVAISYNDLIKYNSKLLRIPDTLAEESIITSLHKGIIKEANFEDNTYLYLKHIYDAEIGLVKQLKNINSNKVSVKDNILDKTLNNIESKEKITLSETQIDAFNTTLSSRVSVITGKPGTGKTTIINCLIQGFKKIHKIKDKDIILCSPTGRASKKMSESTKMEANTIHRLLKPLQNKEGFVHNEDKPLKGKLFIVDEMSMVDLVLAYSLVRAIPKDSYIVFVGDINQLESIGCGEVLGDIIESNVFNITELKEIHRQAENSNIIKNAHNITNNLELIFEHDKEDNDVWFIPATGFDFEQKLLATFKRLENKFGFNPFFDIQTITAKYKGLFGQDLINNTLQNYVNKETQFIEFYVNGKKQSFKLNDKVIQTSNNIEKDIYNGDIGYIEDIEHDGIYVNFYDEIIFYKKSELDQLKLSYSITVHKSQGSEFKCVIIPVDFEQNNMLKRHLIYTALTRGKEMVIFIGNKEALNKAIHTLPRKRFSSLKYRLTE